MGDIEKFAEKTVTELDDKLKDVRIPRANLGPCPVCGRDIVENRKGYSCWGRDDPGCGFVIWKGKAGKQLPVSVARELITHGRTEKPVTGFKSRAGRSFRARLALEQNEEGKWRVEFDEPWAKEGAASHRRPRPRRPRRDRPETSEPPRTPGGGGSRTPLRRRAASGQWRCHCTLPASLPRLIRDRQPHAEFKTTLERFRRRQAVVALRDDSRACRSR